MAEQIPNPDKIKKEKERIKEEVQAFKERTEGLNPDMFAVPGEGSLEEEKEEIPEEILFAYELEEKIAEYTKKARLVKENVLEEIESDLNEGQTSQENAWYAILGFSFLTNSPLWSEISKHEQEELIRKAWLVEDNVLETIELHIDKGQRYQDSAWSAIFGLSSLIRSPLWSEIDKRRKEELIRKIRLVKDKALETIESRLDKSKTDQTNVWDTVRSLSFVINFPLWSETNKQKLKELIEKVISIKGIVLKTIDSHLSNSQASVEGAWGVILDLFALITLKDYLVETANQKLKEQEHQKALHPEKEIPPRPEFPSF